MILMQNYLYADVISKTSSPQQQWKVDYFRCGGYAWGRENIAARHGIDTTSSQVLSDLGQDIYSVKPPHLYIILIYWLKQQQQLVIDLLSYRCTEYRIYCLASFVRIKYGGSTGWQLISFNKWFVNYFTKRTHKIFRSEILSHMHINYITRSFSYSSTCAQ